MNKLIRKFFKYMWMTIPAMVLNPLLFRMLLKFRKISKCAICLPISFKTFTFLRKHTEGAVWSTKFLELTQKNIGFLNKSHFGSIKYINLFNPIDNTDFCFHNSVKYAFWNNLVSSCKIRTAPDKLEQTVWWRPTDCEFENFEFNR